MWQDIVEMREMENVLLIYAIITFLKTLFVTGQQDPLHFQYADPKDGRIMWISKNTQYGPIPYDTEIRYRAITRRPGYAPVYRYCQSFFQE